MSLLICPSFVSNQSQCVSTKISSVFPFPLSRLDESLLSRCHKMSQSQWKIYGLLVWGRTRVFERAPKHHIARWQKCKLRRVASGGVVKWVVGILRDSTWVACQAGLEVGHLRWTNLNDFGAIFKPGKAASSISLNLRKIIRGKTGYFDKPVAEGHWSSLHCYRLCRS